MDINKTALYTTTLGVAVADAYGVPYEFRSREQMKARPASDEMTGGGIHGMPVGTWSDDTSLTLASVDSIVRCGEINLTDMAQRFANWYDHAAYTADGDVFDIGGTCGDAIDNFISGMDVSGCGLTNLRSNGNGSLMRIAPVAVYCANMPDAEAIEVVHKASAITHAHPISMVGCGIYYFIIIVTALVEHPQGLAVAFVKPPQDAELRVVELHSTGVVIVLVAPLVEIIASGNFDGDSLAGHCFFHRISDKAVIVGDIAGAGRQPELVQSVVPDSLVGAALIIVAQAVLEPLAALYGADGDVQHDVRDRGADAIAAVGGDDVHGKSPLLP